MFAVCIESSHARGLGHLYRSLTLATALNDSGQRPRFLINEHPSSISLIRSHGYEVDVVDFDAEFHWEGEWLRNHPDIKVWVNDRLNTSLEHASRLNAAGVKIVTFDDRGDGAALADLHIAALAFDDVNQLQGKRVFSGVDYLLLDPRLETKRRLRREPGSVLVTMGGSDTWGVTPFIMQALLARGRQATVVLGPSFGHVAEVEAVLAEAPAKLFHVYRGGVPSLTDEMTRHELAITGGGMTPFQANAIGLPCIVIASEPFEIPVGRALEQLGGSVFAGFRTDIDLSLLDGPLPVAAMSQTGMSTIDLCGCRRVADELLSLAMRHR